MAATGVRCFRTPARTVEEDAARWFMHRARSRRRQLDVARAVGNWWGRRVIVPLEMRWAVAARDLRDALDLERPRTR